MGYGKIKITQEFIETSSQRTLNRMLDFIINNEMVHQHDEEIILKSEKFSGTLDNPIPYNIFFEDEKEVGAVPMDPPPIKINL